MENRPTVAVQIVSPEQAMLWLASDKYAPQRNLNQNHVSFLADEMRQEAFKQDTMIEFCSVNGIEWLTDGQHRLTAVVVSGIPQRFVIVRRPMLDEESVALDYTRTDKGKPRTIAEDYRTLDLRSEFDMDSFTKIEKLGAAVQFINAGFYHSKTGKMHSKPRLRLMREYAEAASLFFIDVLGAHRVLRHRLDRRATLGVALVTYRYSTDKFGDQVSDFWSGVALDDGLRSTDPRKHALKHLMEVGMMGSAATMRAVTPTYSSRFIARCFNLYVSGETTKQIKIMDPTQPILILGSPFDGKA